MLGRGGVENAESYMRNIVRAFAIDQLVLIISPVFGFALGNVISENFPLPWPFRAG